MKVPFLRTSILGATALFTCFATSANAATPKLSSGRTHPSSSKLDRPFHVLPGLLDDTSYVVDDGTAEDAIAFGTGAANYQALWFSEFVVVAGGESISSVDIAWGSVGNETPASELNGLPVQVAIWSDPNNDGDPSDAQLLASVSGTIESANTDTFVTYTFPAPVNVGGAGTSFFVGELSPTHSGTELLFQALDTNSASSGRSWVAAMNDGSPVDFQNVGNNDFRGTIDSFGLPRNWLIRANGVAGAGGVALRSAVSRHRHGNAGPFDIALPGIEPRTGPANIIFRFSGAVTAVDSVNTSCGSAIATAVAGNEVSVTLDSSACDAQEVVVTLNGIHDTQGNVTAQASTTVSFLAGDVTGNRIVDNADVDSVNAQLRQRVTDANFRNDINPNGKISPADLRTAKQNRGNSLP